MNKLIEQIKRCRVEKNISLKELSDKTSIELEYLNALESGSITNPSLDIVEKIVKVLDVELTILYKN